MSHWLTKTSKAWWPLALLSTVACTASTDPEEIVTVDEEDTADTVLLLLSARAEQTDPAQYLDAGHLEAVELRVNGNAWGRFPIAETFINEDADDTLGPWRVSTQPTQALVVATLGQGLPSSTSSSPETAGDWLDILSLQLAPGDHVAELVDVLALDDDGEQQTFSIRRALPFTVMPGFRSAFIGEIELDLPLQEDTP